MDERSQVLAATLLGAVAGGLVGFLYLTDRGRKVRDQIEPMVESMIGELDRARGTVEKARDAAIEGRRAVDDLLSPKEPRSTETVWETPEYSEASS